MEEDQNMFKHLLTTEVTLYQLCKLDLSFLHYLLLPMEYLLSMKVVISQLYKLNMCPLYLFILCHHHQYSSIANPCTLVEELSTATPHINKLQKLYTTTHNIKLKKFDTTTNHIKLKKFDTINSNIKLKKFTTTHIELK